MSTRLSHSPADIVRHLLVALGRGTLPSDEGLWPIYATGEPSSPDNVITVYDTPGRDQGRTHQGGKRNELRGVQIRVRSSTHADGGYVKANDIAIDLDQEVYDYPVLIPNPDGGNDYRYVVHSVNRIGDVIPLGKDTSQGSKRSLFVINILVVLRQLFDGDEQPGGYLLLESGYPISLS